MQSKGFQREIEKGLSGSLYFLWSEEAYFLDDALSMAAGAVSDPGNSEFNYDAFDSSSEPQAILDAALTLPFMAGRRLVVLKDFHLFPAAFVKALMSYFHDPAETTCMIITSRKAPKASWKADWKVYGFSIRDRDIPAWAQQVAQRKGIRLSRDAVEYLIEFVGYDTGLLAMEIEKLSLTGKKTITGDDIVASTSIVRTYTAFDLIDSLISGQKAKAFRILSVMFTRNAMEAPGILGALNWHYKQFYSLWQNKGKRPAKMNEQKFRIMMKYLPGFQQNDFHQIFQSLHEADLGIKTSGRPELVLEVLMIRLLQKGAAY